MESNQMDPDELKSALEAAGFTQYEANAYTTIIELGGASAVEIADACDVPQARIYDVLRELEANDYIETYQQGSLHARAHDPNAVMERLTEQAETLTTAKDELERRWKQPTLEEHTVSIVKRGRTVCDRASERIRQAENEIHLALTAEQFYSLEEDIAAAYESGVVVKLSLHPKSHHDSLPLADLEDDFEGTVSQVRYRRLPTPFLVIVDRNRLFYTPQEYQHPAHEYGMIVNDYSLSHLFHWFFQTAIWDPWEEVYDDRSDDPPIEYTSIRECLVDIKLLREDDPNQMITATVRGYDRMSRVEKELTGEVTNITYSGSLPADGRWRELITYTESANFSLETEGQSYTIGGHGAMIEDIEARRIVIESVE